MTGQGWRREDGWRADWRGSQRRGSQWCGWALSLALHGVLLAAILWQVARRPVALHQSDEPIAGTMLRVDLGAPAPLPTPVPPRSETKPVKPTAPGPPPRRRDGETPSSPTLAEPTRRSPHPVQEHASDGALLPQPVSETRLAGSEAKRAPDPKQTDVPTRPPASAIDQSAAGRADYAAEIWRKVARRRPHGLRLAGTARVHLVLGSDGRVLSVALVASSGNAALDAIALRTVRAAAPFPPAPEGLAPDALAFTIPFQVTSTADHRTASHRKALDQRGPAKP